MYVQLLSDIHTEFWCQNDVRQLDQYISPAADVLIVAGDLTTPNFLKRTLEHLSDQVPDLVYVTGNHCHYRSSIADVKSILSGINKSNFHWLDNSATVIGGQRFLGGTLWFPANKDSLSPAMQYRISDFDLIDDIVPTAFQENKRCIDFLRKEVTSIDFVVTHHLPSQACVDPRFLNSPLNCFFVGEADDVIVNNKPAHWAFGHSHSHTDMIIDQTRCIANPLGYPGELGVNFDPHFLIEV